MGEEEDGTKFYYDTYTSNISFLQTASDLQQLGIKNNKFFLKLYNRDLLGVDPYSNGLSKNMIAAILMECKMNPYYFLREISRIPEVGGIMGPGGGSPFILHRGNLAATFCFVNSIDFWLTISRQCFKTHSIIADLLWAYIFGTTQSQFNFMNKRQPDADANLKKFKQHKQLLPIWMQQKYNFTEDSRSATDGGGKIIKGVDNVRTIENPVTGNIIESKPSATSMEAADGIGRGNTAPFQWSDETEFTKFMGVIIQASGPAYVRAAQIADRNNSIHCRIFSSTPGNVDSEPVESTNATRENAVKFTEKFYDWSREEIKDYINLRSKNGIVLIEYQYRQIGMDEKYFQDMVRVLEHDPVKIKREVLLQRIRGSNDSPFSENDLNDINDNRKAPVEEIVINKFYLLYIYEKLNNNVPYLVAVDPATGKGLNSDNTSIMIVDPFTLKSVANLVTPYSDAVETAGIIVEIMKKYTPLGLLIIEANSLGAAIISIIGRTEVANRLYYNRDKMIQEDGVDKVDRNGYLDTRPELRRYWGFTTTEKNRNVMTRELLTYAVSQYKTRFISRELIDDLNNLIQKPSGRIEARAKYHDDVVMSYLIALYVYEFDKSLYKWGIIKGMKKETFEEKRKPQENTYENVYDALSEEEKEFFSDPNEKTSMSLIDISTVADNILDGADRNEIFENWIKKRPNMAHRAIQSDGTEIKVTPNLSAKEMIEKATNNNTLGISQDVFDICDIINKG